MSTIDHIVEIASSVIFLIIGIWGTAFGYDLVSDKMIGDLRWRAEFQSSLRWLGPALVLLCVGSLGLLCR